MSTNNFNYIKSITLEGFCGNQSISWSLQKGANVLSGSNGTGKSTLIQALSKVLKSSSAPQYSSKPYDSITVTFCDGSTISSKENKPSDLENIDIISTFDMPLKISEAVKHLSSSQVVTDLDWELYRCLERFLRFQLNLGKKVIQLLLDGADKSVAVEVTKNKEIFIDLIDQMFKESGKSIVRDSDDLLFDSPGGLVTPFQLSSGEKQLLIIFITVLTQGGEESILIMDEPEISLHHIWQRQLINNILILNPKLQLITSTHSPALIMDGWLDRVVDISEIATRA
ncbi:MAG: AAA family ATPase [Rikenellaceae bacterium]